MLVGGVGAGDVARPVVDRRDPGLDDERRGVAPVLHPAEPRRRPRSRSAPPAASARSARPPRSPPAGRRRAARRPRAGARAATGRRPRRARSSPRTPLDAHSIGRPGRAGTRCGPRSGSAPGRRPSTRRPGSPVTTTWAGERCGCRGRSAHSSLSRRMRLEQQHGLVDRADRAALVRVPWREAGVAAAALDVDRAEQRAAARDPDGQRARLGHDRRVRRERAGADEAAGAGRLLLAHRVDQQVAAQADAELGERLRGEDHRGDAALHVAGAAAVDQPVAALAAERVGRPGVARVGGDDVDVAVEQQGAAAARAGEARGELRPPGEVEALGDVRMAGDEAGIGLAERDLGAVRGQPLGEEALQRGELPARLHGVEGDEALQQRDELVLAGRDRGPRRAARAVEHQAAGGAPSRRGRPAPGATRTRRVRPRGAPPTASASMPAAAVATSVIPHSTWSAAGVTARAIGWPS